MIHFISGKPRGGKTFWALHLLVEQLTKTDRFIVTNLKLYLDELQEYLDARGHNVHVIDRLRMLDDAETKHFWLCRFNYDLPRPEGYEEKGLDTNVDYTPLFVEARWFVGGKLVDPATGKAGRHKGHAYFIDEIHNHFPSRAWTSTPRHLLFYNSQHGKLGDECFFITQSLGLVEKQTVVLAQDFTYVRNHRLEKIGMFRGDDKFTWKVYNRPATGQGDFALDGGRFPLDLALANCYDTSAGVGMPGGGQADGSARAQGAPLKLLLVAGAAVLVFAFWFFSHGLSGLTRRYLAPALAPQQMATVIPGAKVAPVAARPALVDKPPALPPGAVRVAFDEERPEITGLWIERVRGVPVVHVRLDNGELLPPRWVTAYCLEPGQEWVEAKGMRYFMRRAEERRVATLEAKPGP